MLIRLRVKGFKSLEDVEVRFGPLTCVVGPNGAGKSNLFDSIQFLSRLADMPIDSAAGAIRGAGQHTSLLSLFTATKSRRAESMEFEADFLVDSDVVDDSGRIGRPSATALRYALRLRRVADKSGRSGIEIESESLCSISKSEALRYLGFTASAEFVRSVFGSGLARDFLSTRSEDAAIVDLHREQAPGVSVQTSLAQASRTVLSSVTTLDYPTALAARREMQSWAVLRLEPNALRTTDDWSAPARLSPDGAHLPSTIERLNQNEALAHRLASLLPGVVNVGINADKHWHRKSFYLEMIGGGKIDANSVSDGVVRLLALAVLGLDLSAGKTLCIEEPENGIHPASLGVVVDLFAETVVDPLIEADRENPLRQIIFNTHAPSIVRMLSSDKLLVARTYQHDGVPLSMFSPMANSWRASSGSNSMGTASAVSFGALLAYLEAGDDYLLRPGHASTLLRDYREELDRSAP